MRSPAAAKGKADAAAGAKDASAASKGPLTPAEKEAAFRKRQIEAQKASEKDKQALQEVQTRKQNCASAQETLRSMEGGQRIARTDAKGERHGQSVVQLISAPFNAS